MSFSKNTVIILASLLAALTGSHAACSSDDLSKISDCYKKNVFDPYQLPMVPMTYINYYLQASSDVKNLGQICDAKRALTTCLTDSVIQNCFNVNDFAKVGFCSFPSDADAMVANYLQLDYICGAANKLVMDKGECALNIPKKCGDTTLIYRNCDSADNYTKCAIQESKDNCGAAAGCFVQKYLSLQTCYDVQAQKCGICPNIDYSKNPVNGMCSDDNNYSAGNSIALSFVLILTVTILNFI